MAQEILAGKSRGGAVAMAENFDSIFADSFRRVMGDGAYRPEFTNAFYDYFLASSPAVAERFATTDMARQKTMLHDSLFLLVEFNRSRKLTKELARLAHVHSHREHDISPELYALWQDALLRAVADFDEQYDDRVDLAWRLTLAPGITYLLRGYNG